MRSQFQRKRKNLNIRKQVRLLEHIVRMDSCRNTDPGFLLNETDRIQSQATSAATDQIAASASPLLWHHSPSCKHPQPPWLRWPTR